MTLKKYLKAPFKIIPLSIFSFLFLLLSCEKKTGEIIKENETKNSVEKTPKNPPVYLDTLATEEQILAHFELRKNDLTQLLNKSTSENANELYKNYRLENDSALLLLQLKNTDLLEKYYEFGDYLPVTEVYALKYPKDVEKKVNLYKKNGIQFWEIGEAMTELRMFPEYYAKMFANKLTPDFQKYLDLITQDDQELFVSDASLSVPWSEAAKRVEDREKFLKDHPNSSLNIEIKEELIDYQYAFLLGYDNTQTNEQGVFNKENVIEFKKFIKNNPDSNTTKIIKEMLAQEWTSDQLHDFVRLKLGEDQY